jgi:hypothetical protein
MRNKSMLGLAAFGIVFGVFLVGFLLVVVLGRSARDERAANTKPTNDPTIPKPSGLRQTPQSVTGPAATSTPAPSRATEPPQRGTPPARRQFPQPPNPRAEPDPEIPAPAANNPRIGEPNPGAVGANLGFNLGGQGGGQLGGLASPLGNGMTEQDRINRLEAREFMTWSPLLHETYLAGNFRKAFLIRFKAVVSDPNLALPVALNLQHVADMMVLKCASAQFPDEEATDIAREARKIIMANPGVKKTLEARGKTIP